MEHTQTISVAASLRPWLLQAPSEADVLEYARKLTPEQVEELQEAVDFLLAEFYSQLRSYMSSIGWTELFTEREITEQFITFADLTQYSAQSVAKNLARVVAFKQVPQSPSELPKVMRGFLGVWLSAISLKAAPYYLDNAVIADSLIGTSLISIERFEAIKQEALSIMQRDQDRLRSNRPYTPAEIARDQQHFDSLGFLPQDIAERLAKNYESNERSRFVYRTLRVLAAIDQVGISTAKENPEEVKKRLWQALRLAEEDEVLAQLEADRLAEVSPDTELATEARFIARTWTRENILSRQAAQLTLQRVGAYTQEAKLRYRRLFADMMASNMFVTFTFGEELAGALVPVLELERDLAVVRRIIDSMKEYVIFEDAQQHAEVIISEIFTVFQALPASSESPRYSRATPLSA